MSSLGVLISNISVKDFIYDTLNSFSGFVITFKKGITTQTLISSDIEATIVNKKRNASCFFLLVVI